MVKVELLDKIMGLFLPELSKKFTIRKISTLTKLSYDATYRYVHFLIKEGVFKEEKVGAYSYVGINPKSDDAKKMIERVSLRNTQKFLNKNGAPKRLLAELVDESKKAAQNELISIILYGSYAKGTATKNSDIDILIVTSTFDVSEKLERVCGEIERRYGKLISPLITTTVELKKMIESTKPMVAHEILLDGVVLYGYESYYCTVFEVI